MEEVAYHLNQSLNTGNENRTNTFGLLMFRNSIQHSLHFLFSRKRKLLKEQERVKHMYSGGPEVVFLDKIDTEKEEKMDIDEPPLKIVVNNDGQPERNEPGILRMRMHADAIEDDDSESDEDDDRREKRDKWKGRIEKKENKMEVRTEKPTLDLRSKLQSRQRHGFNFKNRPSLSIEIKEEPE